MLSSPQTPDSSAMVLDRPEQSVQGIFEPPNGFVLAAIARYKLIVGLCAIALALIGVVYGLSRPKTYTATATLQVGQANPNSPGFGSYVQSSSALATVYSHAIDAEPVLTTIQQKLKLAPSETIARLSSEPLPQIPVFRVIATGSAGAGAIRLANVAAEAIIAYENQSNSASQVTSLLNAYHEASLNLQRASAKLAEFESLTQGKEREAGARAHGRSKPPDSSVFVPDKAEVDTAAAKVKAIAAAYTAAVASQAPRTGFVSVLANATSASGNKRSKVEMYGVIGLLAGLVIGCAVAVLFARRRAGSLTASAEDKVRESEWT
jgi:capsular polysaccharide biosynthesis protein